MPRVKLNPISSYYETHGNGEPLLLIAGLGSDNASWAGVIGKLAEHFKVITFDNRGAGRSDTPDKKYSIREMADDVTGLLDHLQIKKCHIIGHSMGGYIAQELAIYHPERVSRLILEATAPASSARNNMLFNEFYMRFNNDHDIEALMRLWSYWLFSIKTFERKDYIANFVKYASAYPHSQSAEGFKGQIDAIASFDVSAEIKNIKSETFVMIGADDILIYPEESMKLVRGIEGSVFDAIKDTAHCMHVENPDVFTSRAIQYLKR